MTKVGHHHPASTAVQGRSPQAVQGAGVQDRLVGICDNISSMEVTLAMLLLCVPIKALVRGLKDTFVLAQRHVKIHASFFSIIRFSMNVWKTPWCSQDLGFPLCKVGVAWQPRWNMNMLSDPKDCINRERQVPMATIWQIGFPVIYKTLTLSTLWNLGKRHQGWQQSVPGSVSLKHINAKLSLILKLDMGYLREHLCSLLL